MGQEDLAAPAVTGGLRISHVIIDLSRSVKLFHPELASHPRLLGPIEGGSELGIRYGPLPAEAACDPTVWAVVVGKDPFAPTALVAYTFDGEVHGQYSIPGRPRPNHGNEGGSVTPQPAGVETA